MKKFLTVFLALAVLLCCGCSEVQPQVQTSEPLAEGNYLMIPLNEEAMESLRNGEAQVSQYAIIAYVGPEQTGIGINGYNFSTVPVEMAQSDPNSRGTIRTPDGKAVTFYKEGDHYYFGETVTKTKTCYASDGTVLWEMTLKASFEYDNDSVACKDVEGTVTLADGTSWYVIDQTPTIDGTTATYTVTFGREALGITTCTESYSITITGEKGGIFT